MSLSEKKHDELRKDSRLVHLWGRSIGSSPKHNNPMTYNDCVEAINRINEIKLLEETREDGVASDVLDLYRNLKRNADYHGLNFYNPYDSHGFQAFFEKHFLKIVVLAAVIVALNKCSG